MIDAHQHFWRIDRGDYGWMDDSVSAIRRDILPADLAPLAQAGGVTGTIAVQAAPTLAETRYLLSLADQTPLIRGVVGWVDLAGDLPAQLAQIAHPRLKGIRPMLQDIADTDWILHPAVLDGLRQVAAAGLCMDALITPRHLQVIDRLARHVPELDIIIDHGAKPRFHGTDPGVAWRQGLARLATHSQISCKLSGLANEFGPGWSVASLQPVFDHLYSCFGADRLIWGSDWPVLELAGTYPDWLATAQTLAARLSTAERHALFAGTACRVYDLQEE